MDLFLRSEVKAWLRDERGSAAVEMVILAMPLFIPLIMLASHLTAVSASKIEISHLARTSLRAFVTAPSTPLGHARVQQVLQVADAGAKRLWALDPDANPGSEASGGTRFTYLIECRRNPCIQPSNRIRITVEDRIIGSKVSASLTTDQWIQGESGYTPTESQFLGLRDVADVEERISPFLDAKDLIDQAREILKSLPSR